MREEGVFVRLCQALEEVGVMTNNQNMVRKARQAINDELRIDEAIENDSEIQTWIDDDIA